MSRQSLRYLALIGLLLAGVAGSRLMTLLASPDLASNDFVQGSPGFSFHVDVAGWYKATADEAVARSPYALSRQALPESLPLNIAQWHGTELGTDADIKKWFDGPDLVMRRRYEGPEGRIVWVTAIGSEGAKSFRIFEHTPHSCYPSADWISTSDGIHRVAVGDGSLAVRRGVFESQGIERIVYYWYQWEGPNRDAAQGVSSWRVTTDVEGADAAGAEALLAGWINLLFEETLPYHRF